jgi:hypothetical protein
MIFGPPIKRANPLPQEQDEISRLPTDHAKALAAVVRKLCDGYDDTCLRDLIVEGRAALATYDAGKDVQMAVEPAKLSQLKRPNLSREGAELQRSVRPELNWLLVLGERVGSAKSEKATSSKGKQSKNATEPCSECEPVAPSLSEQKLPENWLATELASIKACPTCGQLCDVSRLALAPATPASVEAKARELAQKWFTEMDGTYQDSLYDDLLAFAAHVAAEQWREAMRIVETEEELDGDPPVPMSEQAIAAARAIVRATKKSIIERMIRQSASEEKGT